MSVSLNIDMLLKKGDNKFVTLVNKLVFKHLEATQKELSQLDKFNKMFYETVRFAIQKYNEEEGALSKLFYRTFGVCRRYTKRREQLNMLGGNLKAHISQLKRDRKRVLYHHNNLLSSYESLKALSDFLSKHAHDVKGKKSQNKCNRYLKVVYKKMDEVNTLKKSLEMKEIYLESCIANYTNLLNKIPRNKQIVEEKYVKHTV